MKLLTCVFCDGEVDIIDNERAIFKKIKCRKCGFTNTEYKKKNNAIATEVVIIKRRPTNEVEGQD